MADTTVDACRSAAPEQPVDPSKADAAAEVVLTIVDTPDDGNTESPNVGTLTSVSEATAPSGVEVSVQGTAVGAVHAVDSGNVALDKTYPDTAVASGEGSDVSWDGDDGGTDVLELLRASGLEQRGPGDKVSDVNNPERDRHKVRPRVVHKAVSSKEEAEKAKKRQEREDEERNEIAKKKAEEEQKKDPMAKKENKSHSSNAS